MIIKNTPLYDFLKALNRVILPALGTLYAGLSQIWNLPFPEEIPATIMLICAFLGSLLEISNANFRASKAQGYTDFLDVEPTDDNSEEGLG